MHKKLAISEYIAIGSMLFGLFFGAGNLIFPVHMGQLAGSEIFTATLGFVVTAVGLPFLGILAIGLSRSDGLFDLAGRVHPYYAYAFTILLYMTIGPFFALPRTGTVAYEIGLSLFVAEQDQTLMLAVFTILFFGGALFFALRPNKILTWVGKVLNPIFLVFLSILIIVSLVYPMGTVSNAAVHDIYATSAFLKGFTEGYNTMDALAALAFGIIVVQNIKELGVTEPKAIAWGTFKAGIVSVILMCLIYWFLGLMGATSTGLMEPAANGGIAWAKISNHFFGYYGSLLLAVIVTLACFKTAIGLIVACSKTFEEMFPEALGYKEYTIIFTVFSCVVANIGLTQLIKLSIPVLMFIYPLAIALIFLALFSRMFKDRRCVYFTTSLFTMFGSIGDSLNAMPELIKSTPTIESILNFYHVYLPFYDLGMGWIVPMLVGAVVGLAISLRK
ncbi:MAG TPA: branched-chain amino acid transport system II carrier protein [Candidatus Avacidaminococcus intestinavium]|uniref:Branched-chain amino acid transport system carrier protein n=1 Tax=Candidatus Avacidaminococcus intestinavium TaxID=2840684 RepID=A0A9D1MQN7_9FIRM|nr:branched-chain amino acid transport system II carrier protein [Candidatus Avacidaminococcus intestinavium]